MARGRRILLAALVVLAGCATSGTSPLVERRSIAFPFDADGAHCHRIPSLATAKDGSLVLACESRRLSWRDKSPTDVVVRRSTDNGMTWSTTQVVLPGGDDAQMDPCLVVDRTTGRIFLFACRWPARDHSGRGNTAWLTTSDDHGLSWTSPVDVSRTLFPADSYVHGFAPGSGLQLGNTTAKPGRLVVPVRLGSARQQGQVGNCALLSDDHGASWSVGALAGIGGEFQIAETTDGELVGNVRSGSHRMQIRSANCGLSWSTPVPTSEVAPLASGCQASILGVGKVLLYTGPAGTAPEKGYDNRGRLTLRRSLDGGKTWPESVLLDDRAAGYSCLTRLNDGRIAVVLETADTPTFVRGDAGRHWMRLDVLVLSARVTDPRAALGGR